MSGLIEHKYEPWVTEHRKYGQEAVRRIERNFSQFYDRPLTDVNSWVVEKWRTDRLKAGLSRKTINKDKFVAFKASPPAEITLKAEVRCMSP